MTPRNWFFLISRRLVGLLMVASSTIMLGCSEDPIHPRWLFTSVTGVATAGGTESGVLRLTRSENSQSGVTSLALRAQVPITGPLQIVGGAQIPLLGTVDDETGFFEAEGGGYVLRGNEDRVTFQGGYEGPAGSGVFTGVWTSGDASVYCGQYSGTRAGIVDLVQEPFGGEFGGVTARGVYSESQGASGVMGVEISGSQVTFSFQAYSATGQISADTMSGTWSSATGSESGVWQASIAACGG